MQLSINGVLKDVDVDPEKPLLWVIREDIGLTGTKFGCGIAACGACTVLVDGQAVRSCSYPVEAAIGADVRTIESLAVGGVLSKLQQAWIDAQVPQCGYCQSGMLMAATALLAEIPQPTEDDIKASITNLCRCGTYPRITRAIISASRA
jgi:isoquinoline 1-oxidoreductase subunit alpha